MMTPVAAVSGEGFIVGVGEGRWPPSRLAEPNPLDDGVDVPGADPETGGDFGARFSRTVCGNDPMIAAKAFGAVHAGTPRGARSVSFSLHGGLTPSSETA